MNLLKIIVISMATALLATSCSGGDQPAAPPSVGSEATIAFRTVVPAQQSGTPKGRAVVQLETIHNSFAVMAYKTVGGSRQIELGFDAASGDTGFVVERQTRNGADGWFYDGIGTQVLHYWDFAATDYLFSAYAPVADPAVNAVGWDADGFVSIAGIQANSPDATDWLVARMSRDASSTPITDTDLISALTIKTPTALSDLVDLTFHRLLARVEFRIYSGNGDPFTVTAFSASASDGASFVTTADYAATADWDHPDRWTPQATSASLFSTTLDEYVTGTDRDHATSLGFWREIPQALGPGQTLNLTFEIDGGDVTLEIPAEYVDWLAGEQHVYYIKYSPDNGVILFSVVTVPWLHGDDRDVEQGNW